MKRIKKVLAAGLCAAMIVSLAACGGSNSQNRLAKGENSRAQSAEGTNGGAGGGEKKKRWKLAEWFSSQDGILAFRTWL